MVKIVLIDSQTAFREGVRELLARQIDFELAGVGKDGYDAISLAEKTKPDVVILDIELPLLDGLKAATSILARRPSCAVIINAAKMDDNMIYNAVYCGVTGFVLRSSMFEEINRAVRNVTAGKSYTSQSITPRVFSIFSKVIRKRKDGQADSFDNGETAPPPLNITRAESQVATFVAKGFSNRQIAETLKLKEGTVRNYISNILQKTNLKHRTQLALYALNNGLRNVGNSFDARS
ncbi:MAG: response regulator transcription factor [Spirochaetaceae bacterium]|jgi:DNA-binding NarL/FixJ family response regulator|nr:response regulator transcription factor [Spirochaetaceae bacterium]